MDILELITRRRRQIIVHSVIYYRYNSNLIDDHTFDMWSKELVDLQLQYPEESKLAPLYDEFKDFDGSTGFHLSDNEWGINIANHLLNYAEKMKKRGDLI